MSNVMIIANCHAGPLAQTLAYNSLDLDIDCVGLDSWFGNFDQKAREIVRSVGNDGMVISYNFGSGFGALESSRLRAELGTKFATCTNVRFHGLHPDCTYLGPFGKRWQNFLSEYHSKIVVSSFAAGRSIRDCIKLFNGNTYDKLGYYSVFKSSETELRRRDELCDIKICDDFFNIIYDEYSLLTVNHPTSIIFHLVITQFCKYMNVQFLGHDPWVCPNQLVNSVVWPIFNEIAETHGLRYRTPQYFIRSPDSAYRQRSRAITLEEFVRSSYEYYATRLPPDEIYAAAAAADHDGLLAAL